MNNSHWTVDTPYAISDSPAGIPGKTRVITVIPDTVRFHASNGVVLTVADGELEIDSELGTLTVTGIGKARLGLSFHYSHPEKTTRKLPPKHFSNRSRW